MTIKYFCYACGKELLIGENAVEERIKGISVINGKKIYVEVTAGEGGGINNGEICRACVLKATAQLVKKPKPK